MVCLIKTQVIEFGNETTWSTRRAEGAPGTPFSWATCDETRWQQPCLEAVTRTMAKVGRPGGGCRGIQRAITILVLLLATVLLSEIV